MLLLAELPLFEPERLDKAVGDPDASSFFGGIILVRFISFTAGLRLHANNGNKYVDEDVFASDEFDDDADRLVPLTFPREYVPSAFRTDELPS